MVFNSMLDNGGRYDFVAIVAAIKIKLLLFSTFILRIFHNLARILFHKG